MPGRRQAFQDIANWEPGCEWRRGWVDDAAHFSDADREQLARVLDLDPLDIHFRASSIRVHLHPLDSNVEQPIGEYVSSLDEVCEELVAIWYRFEATRTAVDNAASIAQVQKHLHLIARHPEKYVDRVDHLDPNTLDCLALFLPRRELSLANNGILDPAVLKQAAERVLDLLPYPPRGRPASTGSQAWKRFAEDLAGLCSRFATKPTRRVRANGTEYGPFRDLLEFAVSKMPAAYRMTGKGRIKRVDYLVRVGIQSLRPPCPRKRRSDTHSTP